MMSQIGKYENETSLVYAACQQLFFLHADKL